MKRLRSHSTRRRAPDPVLPLDMMFHTADIVEDFSVYLALATLNRALWARVGGFVRVFEAYVRRVLHGDITRFPVNELPARVIKLSAFAPPSVLARIRALPWAAVFADPAMVPYRSTSHVTGDYVCNEVIRALRDEHVPWLHTAFHPKRSNAVFTVQRPSHMDGCPMPMVLHLLGQAEYPMSMHDHTRAGVFWSPLRQHVVQLCRTPGKFWRTKADGALGCPVRLSAPLFAHVLSIQQMQLAERWWETGEVWLSPMALYSLMTGTVSPVAIHPLFAMQAMDTILEKSDAIRVSPIPIRHRRALMYHWTTLCAVLEYYGGELRYVGYPSRADTKDSFRRVYSAVRLLADLIREIAEDD